MINLKILFKNTTKYSKEVYDRFLAFHSKKYHITDTLYTIVVILFVLFCLILQVKSHHLNLAILICCGLTAFILWRFCRPIFVITKEYKSEKIQKEIAFTYQFYHHFFTIEDTKEYSKIKYYELYKIFETSEFFYLYLDKTHAFLLDKSCFQKNNPVDFSQFIKKKCWWCYKNVK